MDTAGWLTLLHILVLVYWLGADLGAFLSASVLADASKPAPARMAAAAYCSMSTWRGAFAWR